MNKTLLQSSVTFVAIVAGFFVSSLFLDVPSGVLGGSSTIEKASYNAFGTAETPVSISDTNTSTYAMYTKYMDNLHLDVSFTPTTSNQYLLFEVEVSNDEGVTYFPLTTRTNSATEILSYSVDGSGGSGIPVVFPGGKTSTAGTEYTGAIDLTIVADYVRITPKTNTSTADVYVRSTVSTN